MSERPETKQTYDDLPAAFAILKAVQFTLESLAIHRCPVGKTPFFDNARFPWVERLEAATDDIAAEYERMAGAVHQIPGIEELSADQRFLSNDKQWKTLMLRTYDGAVSPLARELCPRTLAAVESIPGARLAFFSILEPGKRLPAHRGPYGGILRFHLGLKIPSAKDGCRIRVGDEWRSWERGKAMVFDDSFDHEAMNETNERRIILFVDFVRPLGAPFDAINRFILHRILDRQPFVASLAEQLEKWEETVAARRRALPPAKELDAAAE